MPVRTRRWNDPRAPDDGLRVLVCRYRPRGLKKADETWDVWLKDLGPSVPLHAAFHAKGRPPCTLDEYRARYLAELAGQVDALRGLVERVRRGETITLLCSSFCVIPQACHRTLLAERIAAELAG